jgi:hypothetical protein
MRSFIFPFATALLAFGLSQVTAVPAPPNSHTRERHGTAASHPGSQLADRENHVTVDAHPSSQTADATRTGSHHSHGGRYSAAVVDVENLVKKDVSVLCREVNDKQALQAIFNSGKPLMSNIFVPVSEVLPQIHMCHGIHVAMRHNWIDLVSKYKEACGYTPWMLGELAEKGAHVAYSQEQFHKTFENNPDYYYKLFSIAARNGDLGILQHDLVGVYGTEDAMNFAVRYGHIEIVQWLHEHRRMKNYRTNEIIRCSEHALEFAVLHNHFDIFQYLFQNCRTRNSVMGAVTAALRRSTSKPPTSQQMKNNDSHARRLETTTVSRYG